MPEYRSPSYKMPSSGGGLQTLFLGATPARSGALLGGASEKLSGGGYAGPVARQPSVIDRILFGGGEGGVGTLKSGSGFGFDVFNTNPRGVASPSAAGVPAGEPFRTSTTIETDPTATGLSLLAATTGAILSGIGARGDRQAEAQPVFFSSGESERGSIVPFLLLAAAGLGVVYVATSK